MTQIQPMVNENKIEWEQIYREAGILQKTRRRNIAPLLAFYYPDTTDLSYSPSMQSRNFANTPED